MFQNMEKNRMKGPEGHRKGCTLAKSRKPLLHLALRRPGKGNHKNVLRTDMRFDQMFNTMDDDRCFPGPRAGQYHGGPVHMTGRLLLLFTEHRSVSGSLRGYAQEIPPFRSLP